MNKQNFCIIFSILIALVISQGPVFPPSNNRCCKTHNIYSIDTSGSMWGTSWSKVQAYLNIIWGSTDYASLFTHGGTWNGPAFQVTNYLTHSTAGLPALTSPNGDTDYNDPIIRATALLNSGNADKTCIIFISDGGEEFYGAPYYNAARSPPALFTNFLNAKRNFERRTGCTVCIKCFVTIDGSYPWNQPFLKMCQKFGAKV
jgi:hypothetical protein